MSTDPNATVKPVTAASVSRVLGKDHDRSRTGKTRLRGVASRSAGYVVTTDVMGAWPTIRVEHAHGRDSRGLVDTSETMVRAYADTLMAAGYIVQIQDTGMDASVITSGRKIR